MSQKIVKFFTDALLIPTTSYAIFELGKNYNIIKSTIQNNYIYNKIYSNIKNNIPLK